MATRAAARIRIRRISWSAGIEDVVANNAGSRIDSAELWEPRLENCLAHGEIKNASIESGLSCSCMNRVSPLYSALQASRRLTGRYNIGYLLRSCGRHYRAALAREHDPKIVVTAKALQLGESRASAYHFRIQTGKRRDGVLQQKRYVRLTPA